MRVGGESAEKLAHAKNMLRKVGFDAPGQSMEELRQGPLAQIRCFAGYRITGKKTIPPGRRRNRGALPGRLAGHEDASAKSIQQYSEA
jgi:hypothetical protein